MKNINLVSLMILSVSTSLFCSDFFEGVGNAVSNVGRATGSVVSDAGDFAGDVVSGTADVAGDVVYGAADVAGDVVRAPGRIFRSPDDSDDYDDMNLDLTPDQE